jgi:hypothetical protein
VADVLEDLFKQTSKRLDDLLLLESSPFSLNRHYLQDSSIKALSALKKERAAAMNGSTASMDRADDEDVREVLSGLVGIGYVGVTEQDLPKLKPADEWLPEMEVMAETTAYWKVRPDFRSSSLLLWLTFFFPPLRSLRRRVPVSSSKPASSR